MTPREDAGDWLDDDGLSFDDAEARFMALGPTATVGPPAVIVRFTAGVGFRVGPLLANIGAGPAVAEERTMGTSDTFSGRDRVPSRA